MTKKSKHDMPGWFPFALAASGLIALGAGIRSNWGRAQAPKPTSPDEPPPPIQKAGVLQDDWAGVRFG